MKKILVALKLDPTDKVDFIDDINEFHFINSDDVRPDDLKDVNVIIGNVNYEMLDHCKNLEYMHLYMAGSDKYVNHPNIKNKAILTNSTGCFGLAISEHMLGYVLYFYKKFNLYHNNQLHAHYHNEGDVLSIYGSKVLVLGLGDIGSEFAKRMHALNADVIGVKKTPKTKPDYLSALYQMDAIDDLIKEADIIALSLPNTKETQHLINDQRLSKMKDNVLLINVGRGSAIDTNALIKHLSDRPTMSAGLDVFEQEPLPSSSLLWKLPNVLITPHVSGARNLAYTKNKLLALAKHNLKAYLADQPLTNVVDHNTGYRKS
ncbi:MAG: D-2-hydroxyacid dehydrogenase [Erysipelotrichaceae bacterium]|nr:D-2-hydroxyacid dehydrogenase [Erysipelotrichaceae bacterium]